MYIRLITTLLLTTLVSLPIFAGSNDQGAPPRPEQLKQLQGSLKALSSALGRIGKEKQREGYTDPILIKAKILQQAAQTMIQQQQLSEAHHKLHLAMDVIKTAIATLRNQETLIRSLNFASPKDEYIYEKERYQGYVKLVDLLIKHKANKTTVELRQQAKIITSAAAQQAKQQHYQEALETQEQSNNLMVRALRHSGIYIPG